MTEYSKLTSLWHLLNEKRIIIPIIQRDYAQGRAGKEYLRERFLGQLFTALQNKNELILDFVYGSSEADTFYPLDGQQRLTTLWLLHWYLSLCAGSLADDGERLAKFSYATRISSRKFCEKLCSIRTTYVPKTREENQEAEIVRFIKNQHWFHYAYEQDPTIQSMLRMLGGTTLADKDGFDIKDGIEEYCLNLSPEVLGDYLSRLKAANSPIKFYMLNMQDKNMPLSDDLYIKMNARGKVLTDFENFKVDLLNYKEEGNTALVDLVDTNGKLEDSFGHLLDTKWTDIFWNHRSKICKIDEIYFEFLNRFFLSWFIANTGKDTKPEDVTEQDIYKTLTGKDASIYKNITVYKPVLTKECLSALYRALNNLHDLYEKVKKQGELEKVGETVNKLFDYPWTDKNGNSSFNFIPKYLEDGAISTLTNQQRVAVHAIFVYLGKCSKVDMKSLLSWMYFVWKMLENSFIDKEQAISAIRFFDKTLQGLSPDNAVNMVDDINHFLASIDENKLPAELFGRRQLKEEIIKAKKSSESIEWKKKIKDAEDTYFFKGAISFLFNDENGEAKAWHLYDEKFERAKQIFDENGVKEEYRVKTLQCLYSYCTDWETQLWWNHKIFNGQAATWKDNILTFVKDYKYVYASSVHHILIGDEPNSEITDERIQALANRSMVEYILGKNDNKRDMYIRWPHHALHFCGDRQGILLSHKDRDQAITKMLEDKRFKLQNGERIPNTDKFWGFDIDLTCQVDSTKTVNIRWYRERKDNTYDIYLLDEQWNYQMRPQEKSEEKGDRKKYYCFNVEKSDVVEDIIDKLRIEIDSIDCINHD